MEYGAAEEMFPRNLEMKYWKAVALANNDRLDEALPVFDYVFERDSNWRELTRRLPASGLLNVSAADLQKILDNSTVKPRKVHFRLTFPSTKEKPKTTSQN